MRTILIVCTLGWLASGCAPDHFPLDLPAMEFDVPAKELGQGVSWRLSREVIVVVPFGDERAADRCGIMRKGFNHDMADAVCNRDPSIWIAELLAQRLRMWGFEVLQDGESAAERDGDPLRVEGSLIQVFVEPVIGAWVVTPEADLSARLLATTKSGLHAERTFFVKGWKASAVATKGDFETALKRATDAMLDEMVAAIEELLERYPQIGKKPSATAVLPIGDA